jgi:hypothetical protein
MASDIRPPADRKTHLAGRDNEKALQKHRAMPSGGSDRSSIRDRLPAKSFETTKNPEDE